MWVEAYDTISLSFPSQSCSLIVHTARHLLLSWRCRIYQTSEHTNSLAGQLPQLLLSLLIVSVWRVAGSARDGTLRHRRAVTHIRTVFTSFALPIRAHSAPHRGRGTLLRASEELHKRIAVSETRIVLRGEVAAQLYEFSISVCSTKVSRNDRKPIRTKILGISSHSKRLVTRWVLCVTSVY